MVLNRLIISHLVRFHPSTWKKIRLEMMENPKIRFKKRQKKVWLAEKVGILIKSKSAKKRWNQIISNKSRCAWIKHPLKRSVRRYLRFDRLSFSYLHPSSSAVRQWLWIISNIHRTLIDRRAHSSAFPFWWLALNSKSNFRLLWLDKQKISIMECWLYVGAVTVRRRGVCECLA